MKKVNTYFTRNGMSCFWAPGEGFLRYHPDEDLKWLHELFGGKCYYQRQTPKIGAGFLLPQPNDVLIEFGYYRVDTGHNPNYQQKKQVGVTRSGQPIFGYDPIVAGGAPCGSYPVVLTDGERVAFITPYCVRDFRTTLINWGNLPWDEEAREITVECMSSQELKFKLLNNGFYGVNALRFIDLSRAYEYTRLTLEETENVESGWERVLSIRKIGDAIYVLDPLFKFIRKVFYDIPTEINGWNIQQNGNKLFCWKQVNNYKIRAMAVNLPSNQECETEIQAAAFDKEKIKEVSFTLFKELEHKNAMAEVLKESTEENVKRILAENPDMVITIEDSLKVGNCSSGTMEFLEKYGLKTEHTARELLSHEKLDEMLKNFAFRWVVAYAKHRDLGKFSEEPEEEEELCQTA